MADGRKDKSIIISSERTKHTHIGSLDQLKYRTNCIILRMFPRGDR